MIRIRKGSDRGVTKLAWLDSRHTFSFDSYQDPNFMHFESLRVINEDIISEGAGFAEHPHENMEIISYVLEGKLKHKDNLGNSSVIRPGEIQRMSAGTGITHSEFNPSNEKITHFLQIWFTPNKKDIEPCYEQKVFPQEEREGQFKLVASQFGRNGSISLNQDVNISIATITKKEKAEYHVPEGRKAWVQVAKGHVSMNGNDLVAGDGVAVVKEPTLLFNNGTVAEILVFDMGAA